MAREDISFAAKKIMLVPELDPRRIKLGYADELSYRLSQHRTAAPTGRCA
jgi:hypothetical protein